MRSVVVCISLLMAALSARPASAAAVWVSPLCDGCCSYATAVDSPLVVSLHAARVNGSASAVTIQPPEDPGLPIGSLLEPSLSNASLAMSTLTFTPLRLHQNMTLVFFIHASHDGATSSLCLRVAIRAPDPTYALDSFNSSANISAAVNCPVAITVAVTDAFYACDVRVSRMSSTSPTGTVTATIPNHELQRVATATRHSLTLKFVPEFGSESSVYTACFIGSDAIGMRPLAEVCVTWTVAKCE
jgi:hypothetical protein